MTKKTSKHLDSIAVDMSSTWITIYSDMMTNLMIFFLILWAYTQFVKQEMFKPVIIRNSPEETAVRKELQKEMTGVGTVVMTNKKVTIRLPSAVLFDSGRADLKPAAFEALDKVAVIIQQSTAPVVVEGFTDDVPILVSKWRSNWELSSARAFSVIQYFMQKHTIAPTRLAARGYGPYRPIAPYTSDENRTLNRRIEISLWES
ncbi:MAG TPA: flagellar motor protein MotB, partial [Elusimicrobiota bacterium]|nr:flagellar motor protein MotB [Elusimicrobiota bacterium]